MEAMQLPEPPTEVDRHHEFLAMLAHELRNPLAPIQNALELMRLCPSDRLACARAREIASEHIQHLSRLVEDLVDVSRVSHGRICLRKEVVDLAQFVNQAVETVRTSIDTHRQMLSVSLPFEPIRLEADPPRLVQVLSSLLNNAMKYTPDGGRIWLTAEREEHDVVLRIRDTGIGMASELLPRVFDLFTQGERELDRSQGGLGIGLTMVRSLVELHRGSVVCWSDGLGQGSEFIVRLPVLPESSQRLEQPLKVLERPIESLRRRSFLRDHNISAAEPQAS
jgi:signal transduction histidine kinase